MKVNLRETLEKLFVHNKENEYSYDLHSTGGTGLMMSVKKDENVDRFIYVTYSSISKVFDIGINEQLGIGINWFDQTEFFYREEGFSHIGIDHSRLESFLETLKRNIESTQIF